MDLYSKYNFYSYHAQPPIDDCDGLIFTALTESARSSGFDITRFRDKKGAWHRNVNKNCYPGKSGSSISRDQLLGLYWYIWQHSRGDLALDLYKYALKHGMIMGSGEISRTYMTPNMINTLGHLIKNLTGKWTAALLAPTAFTENNTGYEAHLTVLHLLLRREMGLGNDEGTFARYRSSNPSNALFVYATGRLTAAAKILMQESLFPNNRLPTSDDRKEPWLWQRDYGPSWEPLRGANRTHSGGDFLFVAYLVLRDLKVIK